MASLQHLAPYLAAGIDVENPAWGRGKLVGLPCFDLHGRTQDAHVLFTFQPPDEVCSGVVELSKVKPVLYSPDDLPGMLATRAEAETADEREAIRILETMSRGELQRAARLTDVARALGIALNLSPTDYIRKPLSSGLQEGTDYCPNTGFPL